MGSYSCRMAGISYWNSSPSTEPSIGAANLTEVGAVGDRAADRVDRLVADNQVEVCSLRTERVIAGHANVRACLPPAMLAADDMRLKGVIHPGTRPHAPSRCLNAYPVAGVDPALAGSRWV